MKLLYINISDDKSEFIILDNLVNCMISKPEQIEVPCFDNNGNPVIDECGRVKTVRIQNNKYQITGSFTDGHSSISLFKCEDKTKACNIFCKLMNIIATGKDGVYRIMNNDIKLLK